MDSDIDIIIDKFNSVLNMQEIQLLNDFQVIIDTVLPSTNYDFSIIENIIVNNLQRIENDNLNKKLIEDFQNIEKIVKESNKDYSHDFNMLKLFKIKETRHSFLLANILNPSSEHGQGKYFLIPFLKKIGIESPEEGHWTILVEKGNVDILIKRQNPLSVVIIENKSNNAIDQPNQLYRYWHSEIYFPLRHFPINYSEQHPEKFKLVYLVPNDVKSPSNDSISKPLGWNEDLPDTIPLQSQIFKFNTEITEWLEESLNGISKENHRLREYIKQYIDFWK